MDTTELSRHEAAAERCKMERWAVDFTRDANRVVTTGGRVVGTFEQPEDAIAVCWLHEQQAVLTAALADAIKARHEATIAMERAVASENEALDRAIRVSRDATARIGTLTAERDRWENSFNDCYRRAGDQLTELHNLRELSAAVETWTKTRHSPNLLAAWERFTKERK